jgi:hypothetical protein
MPSCPVPCLPLTWSFAFSISIPASSGDEEPNRQPLLPRRNGHQDLIWIFFKLTPERRVLYFRFRAVDGTATALTLPHTDYLPDRYTQSQGANTFNLTTFLYATWTNSRINLSFFVVDRSIDTFACVILWRRGHWSMTHLEDWLSVLTNCTCGYLKQTSRKNPPNMVMVIPTKMETTLRWNTYTTLTTSSLTIGPHRAFSLKLYRRFAEHTKTSDVHLNLQMIDQVSPFHNFQHIQQGWRGRILRPDHLHLLPSFISSFHA